jgi:putative transposase
MSDVDLKPSPLQVGPQVPCCLCAQTAAEGYFRARRRQLGADFACAGETEGVSDRRRALAGGPGAHVHRDPAETPSASGIGFVNGKSAIARLSGKARNFSGEHFWARGYAVSTVGFELEQVRQYLREQMPRMVADNSELTN